MNSESPLVSIIMPTYNSSAYILNSLQELEKQTYNNVEIIIVNDGSKDNTLDLLQTIAEKNPQLRVVDKKNGGVSSARNAGIHAARGEFVAFLDDDDRLEPDFILKMYTRQRETNADAVYCGMYRAYEDSRRGNVKISCEFESGFLLYKFLTGEINFHIGCLFVRREYIEKHSLYFNENLRIGEDMLYIYMLLSICKMQSVAEYMYHYVYRAGSVMNARRDSQHYQHEAYAHDVIRDVISEKYTLDDRQDVVSFLCISADGHKIRYMWKLLSLGEFELLSAEIKNNEALLNNSTRLSVLDKKTIRKAKLIKTNSKLIWSAIRLINKK